MSKTAPSHLCEGRPLVDRDQNADEPAYSEANTNMGAGNQKKDKNTRNNNTCGGGIEHLTLLSLLHDYGVLAFNIIAGSDTDEILDQMKA